MAAGGGAAGAAGHVGAGVTATAIGVDAQAANTEEMAMTANG
jgi:hypothetical protein